MKTCDSCGEYFKHKGETNNNPLPDFCSSEGEAGIDDNSTLSKLEILNTKNFVETSIEKTLS